MTCRAQETRATKVTAKRPVTCSSYTPNWPQNRQKGLRRSCKGSVSGNAGRLARRAIPATSLVPSFSALGAAVCSSLGAVPRPQRSLSSSHLCSTRASPSIKTGVPCLACRPERCRLGNGWTWGMGQTQTPQAAHRESRWFDTLLFSLRPIGNIHAVCTVPTVPSVLVRRCLRFCFCLLVPS